MSSSYFNTLNYTLANEDSALEMNVLAMNQHHVLAVAGSGARVLPLFAKSPESLTCVDLSKEQLLLTELRIESARQLSREEYLCFWGYPPQFSNPNFRKQVFSELNLSHECKVFFEQVFEHLGWASVLYKGRWEQTFAKISKLCRVLLRDDTKKIFDAKSFSEHLLYVTRDFSRFRWNTLVFLIGNSTFFNTLLYKGHFPQKNVPGSHRQYYKDAFNRIFASGVPRENFFLQLTLLGELLFEEGNPIECHEGVYQRIQAGIRSAKVFYKLGNVVEVVHKNNEIPIDFVSLSDVPSYFDEQTSRSFLQKLSPGLAPNAVIVARYYLRVISWMQKEGFIRVNHDFERWIEEEKTQMYSVDIFKKT